MNDHWVAASLALWCACDVHTLNTPHSHMTGDGQWPGARNFLRTNWAWSWTDRQQRPAQSGHWSPGLIHIIHVRHVLPSLDSYHPTGKEQVFSSSTFLYLNNRTYIYIWFDMSHNPWNPLSQINLISGPNFKVLLSPSNLSILCQHKKMPE